MKAKSLAAACAALLAIQSVALAHAFLDHAEPKVGDTVAAPPRELKIWFSEDVEPAVSLIEVFNADKKQVDKKDLHPGEKDKSLLIVSLEALPPGLYRVHWRVTSVDTHVTEGHFTFTIKPKD